VAAQGAVGDDADQQPARIGDADAAEALGVHFEDGKGMAGGTLDRARPRARPPGDRIGAAVGHDA
jgi:hypothetical protein